MDAPGSSSPPIPEFYPYLLGPEEAHLGWDDQEAKDFFEIFLKKWILPGVEFMYKYEKAVNFGKPLYKQVKYGFGTGIFEAIADGFLQAYKDSWWQNLTTGQRVGRVLTISGETLIIDRISDKVGDVVRKSTGMKSAEIAAQYLVSGLLTDYVHKKNYDLFNVLGLGVYP